LTLAELLQLYFASLCYLTIYLTTLGIRLTADAQHEGSHENK
jgi:hypothetical protein